MAEQRSSNPNKFFSDAEKERIVRAIRDAEKQTSGEIRLHLEKSAGKDSYERAQEVFHKLKMERTAERNGVIIYLATGSRKFAILGDKGINDVVPENFWQDVVQEMQEAFRQDKFAEGLAQGIGRIGEKLKAYFPHQKDDVNELSDDISIKDI